MNIAIVDDEPFYISNIRKIIDKAFPSVHIQEFTNTKSLLASQETFDILLLDIEMPDMNGLTFAKTYIDIYPHIIFVTTHTELVFDAFLMNVRGFVKKDNMEEELVVKVQYVMDMISKDKQICLKATSGVLHMNEKEILYFDINKDCIFVHSHHEHKRITITTLKKVSELVSDNFIMINRENLVNIVHITNLIVTSHEIKLSNGDILKVSARKWSELLKQYNKKVNTI